MYYILFQTKSIEYFGLCLTIDLTLFRYTIMKKPIIIKQKGSVKCTFSNHSYPFRLAPPEHQYPAFSIRTDTVCLRPVKSNCCVESFAR